MNKSPYLKQENIKTPIIYEVIDIKETDPALIENSDLYKLKLITWDDFLKIFERNDIDDEKKSLFALKVKNINFSIIKDFILDEKINIWVRQKLIESMSYISSDELEEVKDILFNKVDLDYSVREFLTHKIPKLLLSEVWEIRWFKELFYRDTSPSIYKFISNYRIENFDISNLKLVILDTEIPYYIKKIIAINTLPFDIDEHIDIFLNTHLIDDIKVSLLKKVKKISLKKFIDLTNKYPELWDELLNLWVDIIQYFEFDDIKNSPKIINSPFIYYIFKSCNFIVFSEDIWIFLKKEGLSNDFIKWVMSKLVFENKADFEKYINIIRHFFVRDDWYDLKKHLQYLYNINWAWPIADEIEVDYKKFIDEKFSTYSQEIRAKNSKYVNNCQKDFLTSIWINSHYKDYFEYLPDDNRTLVLYLRYWQAWTWENLKLFNLVRTLAYFIESWKSSLFDNLKIVFRKSDLYDTNLEKLNSDKFRISFCDWEDFKKETSFKANVIHLTSWTPLESLMWAFPIIPEDFDYRWNYPHISHNWTIDSILESILYLESMLIWEKEKDKTSFSVKYFLEIFRGILKI